MSIRKPQEINDEESAEVWSRVFPGGLVLDLTTDDFDEMASVAPKWDQEYLKLGKGAFRGSLLGFHTARLQMGTVSWEPGILVRGSAPPRAITLASLLERGGPTSFQGTVLEQNQIIVLQPGQEFELSSVGKSRILVVVVEQALLQSRMQIHWGEPLVVRDRRDRLVFSDPSNRIPVGKTCEELVMDVANHSGLLTTSFFAQYLEQVVLEELVTTARPPKRFPLGPKRYLAAKRAKDYLIDHTEDPISITDLCEATNANERTLLLGFREVFGMPPKLYLKTLRLNRVRQALLMASQEATVTDVAIRWGFTHLSRFAADYWKMFGELPHETLKGRLKTQEKT